MKESESEKGIQHLNTNWILALLLIKFTAFDPRFHVLAKPMMAPICIHVKERKSIFPFPESCPIFLESERKAEFFGKGGKELERKGIKGKIFSSFPYLL